MTICFSVGASGAGVPENRVRVLIDRSHEWLFAYDDVSERMLKPNGFDVLLCDASLDTKEKLKDYDIVMVQQAWEGNQFDFSETEIALLKEYVAEGGNLILVANPKCPIVKVAAAFGFTLKPRKCKLPLIPEAWLLNSFGAEARLKTRPMEYCVSAKGNAIRVIGDQDGAAIAMKLGYGKGEVICFADNANYWDFCAQRDAQLRVPNVPTTLALFRCLVPDKRPSGQGSHVRRVSGERELKIGGLNVFYSNPVESQAKPLLNMLPKIVSLVEAKNGQKTSEGYFGVNILASGGGGWAGGNEIGVQCGGSMYGNIAVISHELTHVLEGPLPGIIGEGWATMVGLRAGADLGCVREAQDERRSWLTQFTNYEKGGRILDITLAEKNRDLFGAYEGKMMWMIEQLEEQFGKDFMLRFLEIRHALKGRDLLDIQDVLSFFSLTAGHDLNPSYRKMGITVEPRFQITLSELRKKLEDYRVSYRDRQNQWESDKKNLEQYRSDPKPFADDSWRDEWKVTDNMPYPVSWIENASELPPGVPQVILPPPENRRGFLMVACPDTGSSLPDRTNGRLAGAIQCAPVYWLCQMAGRGMLGSSTPHGR